jgi:hypothetical protein
VSIIKEASGALATKLQYILFLFPSLFTMYVIQLSDEIIFVVSKTKQEL